MDLFIKRGLFSLCALSKIGNLANYCIVSSLKNNSNSDSLSTLGSKESKILCLKRIVWGLVRLSNKIFRLSR